MSERLKLGIVLSAALVAAVMVGWLCLVVDRQADAIARANTRVEALGDALVGAEVVDLPDDGKAYYTTLIVHDDWRQRAAERALVAAFETDQLLRSAKSQTHFNLYAASNPLYAQRFAKSVPTLPALLIQDATGKVYLKLSGDELTGDVEKVRGPIRRLWQARPIYVLPWRRPCPCPEPTPQPSPPAPDETPLPDATPIPDTISVAPPFPWGWLTLAVLVGLFIPIIGYAKKVFG